MKALEYIAQALASDGAKVEFDKYGYLEADYPDISFTISDQLSTDGYLAATMFSGKCYETGSPLHEDEFTARTALTMAQRVIREAKAASLFWED